MPWILMPEWNLINSIIYSLAAFFVIGFGVLERKGWLTLNYSKFRTSHGISSRLGMFLLYFIPLIVMNLCSLLFLEQLSFVQASIILAINLHFAKRCLEVLFLHKYSGPINWPTVIQIAIAYSGAAAMLAFLNRNPLPAPDALFWIGVLLFSVGQFFNFYHHKLLADLRSVDTSYAIPKGGLFDWVTAPHYLMELSAWLGIAFMSRHFAAYLIFAWTCSYLFARAARTHEWYLEKFADYPKDRRVIVPFIL